jgi:hypothetical protein
VPGQSIELRTRSKGGFGAALEIMFNRIVPDRGHRKPSTHSEEGRQLATEALNPI